jgi:hypothetical protein
MPTAKERQVMDRVQRAQRSYKRLDRHSGYREACADLAEETGANVEHVYEEWQERAGTRLYLGEMEVEDAERLALEDVRERFRAAS